jgi:hypothetical protein
VRRSVATRRTTAAKSWDRPGAGRLLPSRKRGPEGARWVTERWKAPRIAASSLRFTRRRWKRSWLALTEREQIAREAPRFESELVTGVVRGSVVVRCGTSKEKSPTQGEENSPRILRTARRSVTDVVKTSEAPCDETRTGTDEARVLVDEESGSSCRSETSRPSSRLPKGDDGGLAGRMSYAQLTRRTTAIRRNGVRQDVREL